MRIVIGYDDSPCAQDAILDLQRAGLPDDTQALLLAVWDAFPAPPATEPAADPAFTPAPVLRDVRRLRAFADQAVEQVRRTVMEQAAKLRDHFPTWTIDAEARADTPHWALVTKAAEWRADLIVVGSHGRSALGRMFLGSVSQQVLRHAPCSVRVGRCNAPGQPPRQQSVRLVLGIDGSVDSAAAASAVASRSWPAGTEVRVVGVLDSRVILNYLATPSLPDAEPRHDLIADAAIGLRASLNGVCDELQRSGLRATSIVLEGDPKKLLIEQAQDFAADCIIVGARGHTRLERLLLGSVSATIAARAHCSVEIVRASN